MERGFFLPGRAPSETGDFFDSIKYIDLGGEWRLTLGGEFRYDGESETNKAFGATEPAQDGFNVFRYMFHADLKFRQTFRVFAQAIAAFDEERDLAPRGTDENRWDLHQFFFEVPVLGEDLPLKLRVGRQELLYGKQRLVSPLGWAAVRRRFDGVKLFATGDTWDADLWFVRPVLVQRKQRDRFNEDYAFGGGYATYKGIPRHGLDMYLFASNKTGNALNPNGKRGDETRFTLGSRFWGQTGAWDYEVEAAAQWGRWAGDTIQAWSLTLNGGYTFAGVAWKPRLGVGFDTASGDEDPFDGKIETFDQLFPLGHGYFGYLDLIGRQNVTAVNVNLSAWPVAKKVKAAMAYHAFWLEEKKDALYTVGGAPGRRDLTGNSGTEIGHELDLTVLRKLTVHSTLLLGYSHFWDSNFIQKTGFSENADLLYVQYSYKF